MKPDIYDALIIIGLLLALVGVFLAFGVDITLIILGGLLVAIGISGSNR
jgi:hypothetical protein